MDHYKQRQLDLIAMRRSNYAEQRAQASLKARIVNFRNSVQQLADEASERMKKEQEKMRRAAQKALQEQLEQ